ncbi:hypothetical protein [Merismopedia glauca]|uniref:Uncharacterized protein n=1 Tax=Merismopedia glauca CCAP 1448/3 TaxID=1296344 RepID=A0A2T1C1P6_9CYAN|nr:hypothetical protein [Merismopedia glauca]PSB02200.1 hypothetical protein C7B64_14315 [Merismopedia glauca CCAP 1448/3]
MESRPYPKSVKVFEILNLIFGSFGLAITPGNFANLDRSLNQLESLGFSANFSQWLRIINYLSPLIAVILLILGIGLILKQSWSRSGSVIYGWIAIAFNLLSAVIVGIGFGSTLNSGEASIAVAIGAIFGAFLGALVGSIYPILTVIFLSKPEVKAALERRSS